MLSQVAARGMFRLHSNDVIAAQPKVVESLNSHGVAVLDALACMVVRAASPVAAAYTAPHLG